LTLTDEHLGVQRAVDLAPCDQGALEEESQAVDALPTAVSCALCIAYVIISVSVA
jgi:hypothetical protein